MKTIVLKDSDFQNMREVDFFLRLHRHLPDTICQGLTRDGKAFPVGNCLYRPDGIPINHGNDYVDKLQRDPKFVQAEKEIEEAVKIGKPLYQGKLWTVNEAYQEAIKASKVSPPTSQGE